MDFLKILEEYRERVFAHLIKEIQRPPFLDYVSKKVGPKKITSLTLGDIQKFRLNMQKSTILLKTTSFQSLKTCEVFKY